MLFLALVGIFTLATLFAMRLIMGDEIEIRPAMRIGLSCGLLFAGLDHFISPERYLAMMPDFVPYPAQIVMFTGVCELAGAAGLVLPGFMRIAGVMLAVYFVCVFPANVRNAVEGLQVEGLPTAEWYYWVRLMVQPVFVWWALFSARIVDWPFRLADTPSDREVSRKTATPETESSQPRSRR